MDIENLCEEEDDEHWCENLRSVSYQLLQFTQEYHTMGPPPQECFQAGRLNGVREMKIESE